MAAKNEEVKYSKEALLKADEFFNRKDALSAVVADDEEITLEEARKRLNTFMKGKVG